MKNGYCVWITGLSASGKTTTAKSLVDIFHVYQQTVIFFDGDQLRHALDIKAYGKDERFQASFKYAKLAKLLTDQGHIVVIAVIGLFHGLHKWNRSNIKNYFEVFLDVPIDELRRRDPKGIYEAYYNGEVQNVAGLDLQVEYPLSPDLHIKYQKDRTADILAKEIYETLEMKCLGMND